LENLLELVMLGLLAVLLFAPTPSFPEVIEYNEPPRGGSSPAASSTTPPSAAPEVASEPAHDCQLLRYKADATDLSLVISYVFPFFIFFKYYQKACK
jgi:hypothetical protein